MIELTEIGSKHTEIASVIQKSINTVGVEATVLSIAKKDYIKGYKLKRLQDAILTKGHINFTLIEKVGKTSTFRYFVHINVESKEVEVRAMPSKLILTLGKLEVIGGNDAT